MKASFASRTHALRLGKSLRNYFPGIPLATCQEWSAKILGYRDLHELTAVSKSGGAARAAGWVYDEDAAPEEVAKRREFQAARLAELSNIDSEDAAMIVSELAPTAKRRPESTPYSDFELPSAEFLKVGAYMKDGDLNEGLKAALEAIKTGRKATLIGKMSTLFVLERAMREPHDPALLMEVLERGAEAGWVECCYNLAMVISDQWEDTQLNDQARRPPRNQVEKVDGLYAKVIAKKNFEADEDRGSEHLRTAAMVNRAAITRDGLLTGSRDWPGAVRLYEEAAELGNVVGALNAGNVSEWLARKGEPGYAQRAVKWFVKAIQMVEAGEFNEQHCSKKAALERAEGARTAVAHLVMDGLASAEGDRFVASLTAEHEMTCSRGGHQARVRKFIERVKGAREPAAPTPAGNWVRALSLLGWQMGTPKFERSVFDDPGIKGRTIRMESFVMPSKRSRETVRVIVVWDPCLPLDGGFDRIVAAIAQWRKRDQDSYLMAVGRKAVIKVNENLEFTPAWMAAPGQANATMVSISARSTGPSDLVEQLIEGRRFAHSLQDASANYEFAIAVNTLDAGVSAATTWDAGTVSWSGVGGDEDVSEWRMPYYDGLELLAVGIMPPELRKER